MAPVRFWWLPVLLLLALAGLQIGSLLPDFSPADAKSADPGISCTKTLHPGASVVNAISAARGGSTICLESGAYDAIEAVAVKKSPPVTIRSSPGARAMLRGIDLTAPSGLRFVALDLSDGVSVSP